MRAKISEKTQNSTPVGWLVGIILLIVGVGGMIYAAAGGAMTPGDPLSGTLPAVVLTDLDGQQVSLADLQGQPMLVNFWATWCPPCQQEMPALEALYQANKDAGFLVVAINDGEDLATVNDFVAHNGLTFMVLIDQRAALVTQLGVNYLPTTIFVDREGQMRSRWQGVLTPEQMVKAVKALQ